MFVLRPELAITVLMGGIYGLFFHSIVGTRARSIPIYLVISVAGFVAGVAAALAIGLTWPELGGIPVVPGSAGSLLFLVVANRLSLC